MKSLKGKLMVIMLVLVLVSSSATVIIGLIEGFQMTDQVVQTQFESKLNASNNMLQLYLKEQFGNLSIASDGKMVDKDGKSVEGRYDYIDELSQNMGIVATVFAKSGNEFTRVLTTIQDDQGKRVIGTVLDSKGQAYAELSKGNVYFGEADILGKQYITRYAPIFDDKKQIVGSYFVGVPMEEVSLIVDEGKVSTIKSVGFLSIIVLLIAAGVSYLVASSISKPIKKITEVAHEIADGHFDVQLTINSHDELGQLAHSFHLTIERLLNYQGYIDEISHALMHIGQGNLSVELKKDYAGQFKKLKDNLEFLVQALNSTLLQINQSADQVAGGSDQVASGAQLLSQGATEQASSIEELSATINEISNQIRQNAQNVEFANQLVEETGTEVMSGNNKMQAMIGAMQEISEKSHEISKIIKTIDDIAFQTNILALNAAVEAARAGAAGKGFAVVADEVRNLAQKSAEAAKNTTNLIECSIQAVDKGVNIAGETANSLAIVVEKVDSIIQRIEEIALASAQQADGANQITIGVEQISSVVQTNSATAEESAASSEELSGQAQLLKDLVSKFKLKEEQSYQRRSEIDYAVRELDEMTTEKY